MSSSSHQGFYVFGELGAQPHVFTYKEDRNIDVSCADHST